MHLVILGIPGAGKVLQAKLLTARYRVLSLSARELSRVAHDDDQLPPQVKQPVTASQPVDTQSVIALLETRLRARDRKRGFVLDDFPCNIPQAQALDALLSRLGKALQIAIYMQFDEATLAKYIKGRLLCNQCGALYNSETSPPKTVRKCDTCNVALIATHSGDDKSIAAQIADYQAELEVLNTYYKAQHKLRTVRCDGDAEQTQQKICDLIDLEIRPLEVTISPSVEQQTVNTVIAGGQVTRITSPPEPRSPQRAVTAKTNPKTKIPRAVTAKTKTKTETKTKATAKKPATRKTATRKTATKKPVQNKSANKVQKPVAATKARNKKP